ncbi:hypothetical protein ACW4TU_07920 [Streptomyces sp. QTS52]
MTSALSADLEGLRRSDARLVDVLLVELGQSESGGVTDVRDGTNLLRPLCGGGQA